MSASKSGKIIGRALARAFLNRSTRKGTGIEVPPQPLFSNTEQSQARFSPFSLLNPRYAFYGIAAGLLFAGGYITGSSLLTLRDGSPSTSRTKQSSSTSTSTKITTTTTIPNHSLEQEAFILGGTAPSAIYRRVSENFVAEYDTATKNPKWVVERITKESLTNGSNSEGNDNVNSTGNGGGSVSRSKFQFHEDTSIPIQHRARLSDFEHSGFDRGHLSPAADNRSSEIAMKDSFLLTNISPQVGEGFNRDYWARFERFIRGLSRSYKTVYVCTGPLFLPSINSSTTASSPSNSNLKSVSGMQSGTTASVSISPMYRYSHQAIGQPLHWVQVPTHFFKVVVCTDMNDQPTSAAAFVMPNAKINANEPLINFSVPLDSVEAVSGLKFFREMIAMVEEENVVSQVSSNERNDFIQRLQNNSNALVGTQHLATLNDHDRVRRHICQQVDCTLPSAFEPGKKGNR
jgi:endonuclease G, mitochondrial